MRYLITGGSGSIGGALARRLLTDNPYNEVRILSRSDTTQHNFIKSLPDDLSSRVRCILGDVRDKDAVRRAVRGVEVVFHCAAVKHVNAATYNTEEAVSVNAAGTASVLDVLHSLERPINMILLSTDKAADPSNAMGASKLLAEKIVLNASWASMVRRAVVRFGNVFDSRGSVFPTFVKQLVNRKRVKITAENASRYVCSIDTAVDTLLKASKSVSSTSPKIYIPAMGSATVKEIFEIAVSHVLTHHGVSVEEIKEPEIIGLFPGEKLHEACVSEYELNFTSRSGLYFVVDFSCRKKTPLVSAEGLRSSGMAAKADKRDFVLHSSLV